MPKTLPSFLPASRVPALLQLLTVLSIVLPILGGLSAVAAWKLSARVEPIRAAATPKPATPAPANPLPETLRFTQAALREAETALQASREELRTAREQAQRVIAHAADRRITAKQRQHFLETSAKLPKGPISITLVENDAEARQYGEQLQELLDAAGYEVNDEFGAIKLHGKTLVGVRVGAYSNQAAPSHALPLAGCFIDCDIPALPVVNQQVAPGMVDIMVGTNPAAAAAEEDLIVISKSATPAPPHPTPTPVAVEATPKSKSRKKP